MAGRRQNTQTDNQEIKVEEVQENASESAAEQLEAVVEVVEESDIQQSENQTSIENQLEVVSVDNGDNNESDESQKTDSDYTEEDFNNLALLMNRTVRDIKEEIFLSQIYSLMSKIAKVVVRYDVCEAELEQLFKNAKTLKTDGIMVSPAYLSVCKRVRNKNKLTDVKLCSIIDFPFGESTYKTKASSIREGKSYGVIEPTVMMPSMLLSEQNIKQFKSQCSKLGWKKAGIALNATDIDEETLKRAVKASNKTRITHIVYVFGEEPINEVKQKLNMIVANRGTKKIFILANVNKAETVSELIKLGADKILTPYADEIGKELLLKFKIKSVNMV